MQREVMSDEPLSAANAVWWVASMGGKPVGFAALQPTAGSPEIGYLARAGVLHEARGHGIQKKLIRVREAYARKQGMTVIVTDTSNANHASANNLIDCGYRLYRPVQRWAFLDGNYWRKAI